jgi:NhaA family Na+:H+ antiporter
MLQGVPFGIAAGLVAGKVTGVFAASWLLVRFFGASLPARAGWRELAGIALLCGIGFTMSLFIGGLAFGDGSGRHAQVRLGVLAGSLTSALLGTAVLLAGRSRR